jgi:anti-sigma28 factor (negative regulator of flagellin synthesis)
MRSFTHKGHPGTQLSRLMQNDPAANQIGGDHRPEALPTMVNTSEAVGAPERIAELFAREGDQLPAENVRRLRDAIAKGLYQVDPRKVAASMLRIEASWHFKKSKFESIGRKARLRAGQDRASAGNLCTAGSNFFYFLR